MSGAEYVGRFAPSPTGPLHAGSLLAGVASYLDARAAGGRWLVRIEDIDPPRALPGASADILHTLERFGFQWDGDVVFQSQRLERYRELLADVSPHTFFCACTRKQLIAARERLGLGGDQYPGTCRDLKLEDGALRFRLDQPEGFVDAIQGAFAVTATSDDFVVWRKDHLPSYQWAVSVDDVAQGITHVVRGVDLLATTPRQIALTRALGGKVPHFAHVPVLVNSDGQKLSKQTQAPALQPDAEVAQLCAAFAALDMPVSSASTPDELDDLWLWAIRYWDAKRLTNKRKIPFVAPP